MSTTTNLRSLAAKTKEPLNHGQPEPRLDPESFIGPKVKQYRVSRIPFGMLVMIRHFEEGWKISVGTLGEPVEWQGEWETAQAAFEDWRRASKL